MTRDKKPQISLVVPAYNEEKRIGMAIKRLQGFMDAGQHEAEVIIVVEKSSDRSAERARSLSAGDKRFTVISNAEQRGKGFAVRTGIAKARGQYIFFMDCDMSTDLKAVDEFMSYFRKHPEVDVIIGSRAHRQSKIVIEQAWLRRSLGKAFNLFVRLLVLRPIRDTQCGFKAFRLQAAKSIFKHQIIDGFAFDVEVLLLARALGLKAAVLPVVWTNDSGSKVNKRSTLKMLTDLFRIKYRHEGLKALAAAQSQPNNLFVVETDV